MVYVFFCQIVSLKRFNEILLIKPNITNRFTAAPCVLVLFYAHTCPFSAMAAPHFNALARAFPTVRMIAINTKKYQMWVLLIETSFVFRKDYSFVLYSHIVIFRCSINSQFGIVGVPTLVLFHNGRPILKFNRPFYTLAQFSKFLTQCTGEINIVVSF